MPWQIKIHYDLFNHLGSYRNIIQFQISFRKENRLGDTRVIKIRVLRKVFSTQFCFITCRRQHFQAVEQRRCNRFTFAENTISNSSKVTRAMFLGSNGLFCFISICKFGSFCNDYKNPFATITSLSELYIRSRRFIILIQTKKVISMNQGSSTSSWKPWRSVRLDLVFSLRDIYMNSNLNPLKKFTSSTRSTNLKDILLQNISQMITKTIPISTRIVISYVMKWGILLTI